MVCNLLFRRWCCCFILLVSIICASSLNATAHDCDTSKNKVTCYVKDSTGYILEIHRFKNGLKSGDWETFNNQGELIKRLYYKKDQLKWTFFYKDGEIIKSIDPRGRIREFSGCGCT